MAKGPMTVTGFIAFAQGWGGLYIRANKLAWKQITPALRASASRTASASPTAPSACTGSTSSRTAVGAPGAYDYGPERCSWLTHHLTNWMGDDGFLRRAHCKIRRHNPEGDYADHRGPRHRQARRGRAPPRRDRAGGAQPGRRAVGGGRRRGRAAGARDDQRPPRPRGAGRAPGLPARGPAGGSARPPRVGGARSHPRRRRDPKMRRVRLTALFGPEHGLGGVAQDHVHIGAEYDRTRRVPGAQPLRQAPRADSRDAARTSTSWWWTCRTWARATTRSRGPPCWPCACARAREQAGDRARPAEPARRRACSRATAPIRGSPSFVGLYPLPIRHGLTIARAGRLPQRDAASSAAT